MALHGALQLHQLPDLCFGAMPSDVRMAAQRAGSRTGSIKQDGVEGCIGLIGQHIDIDDFSLQMEPL